MILHAQKYIIIAVILSLLFCCGAAWHSLFFGSGISMEGHTTVCGMEDTSTDQTSSDHVYSIISSVLNSLRDIAPQILFVLAFILVFVFLVYDKFVFYFKKTRDRYGGFQLFAHFVALFRSGILHPKIF
ncbi:MAG TPA: hypothetical protein DCS29_00195 [Candidatus Magasanikbacteria bacterium]|nr:MAG: hypothetical protein A2479_03280 [Candidatus Magasanikbacteria bacterium RIFOXYC2_FULL_39_8]HAT03185.1 hypothetical protein [Candidatus Magasanikbacteria bacterium]